MSAYYEKLLATPAAGPRPEVTAAQKDALATIKAHFKDFKLDGTDLGERELMWLSEETLLRYFRATRDDVHEAIARLEATLAFRRKLNLYDVDATAAIAERETQHGTRWFAGWNRGRPVNYVYFNRNPLPLEEREHVQAVFLLERMMDLTPPGGHEVNTIFNFGGKAAGPKPALGQTKEMLANYDKHYPLQPTCTILMDMGWAMRAFVNLVWPFISEDSKKTTHTVSGEQAVKDGLFEKDALIKSCGGGLEFEYDHATYWPTMLRLAKTRRDAYLENWRKLGAPEVGRSEFDWKFV